jgi:hypothetical protein
MIDRGDDIADYLRGIVHLAPADYAAVASGESAPARWADSVAMQDLEWRRDAVWLRYHADAPALLNASISCTPHWRAAVDGKVVPIFCANFGNLLLLLPAGGGELEIRYVDRASDFIFESRYLLLLAALVGLARIVRTSLAAREAEAAY